MQTIKRLFTYFFNGYSEYLCIRSHSERAAGLDSRVSCSILAQAPLLCFMFCGTMFAREKLLAMAEGVGMSPAGAMCHREYPEPL